MSSRNVISNGRYETAFFSFHVCEEEADQSSAITKMIEMFSVQQDLLLLSISEVIFNGIVSLITEHYSIPCGLYPGQLKILIIKTLNLLKHDGSFHGFVN